MQRQILQADSDDELIALATISSTAVLFAKTTLGMQPTALAFIGVVVMASGISGAFFWGRLSLMLSLTPLKTLLVTLVILLLIPLYALLSYLPFVQSLGFFGLQRPWEIYVVALVYGLVLGGLSSYCRAIYAELVPPGSEAAFFALYAVTDKGSSVLGPAIVGAIADVAGEIRPAFGFLAALVLGAGSILLWVDLERGKVEGRKLAEELGSGGDHAKDTDLEDTEGRALVRQDGASRVERDD